MASEEVTASGSTAANPELDVTKLHSLPSEQQDLYLLTFSSDLTRHVAALDADGATSHQVYVKKELLKIINLSSPAPNRVIRNNVGVCFAGIFSKGDRKLLFETINELLAITTNAKSEKAAKTRHAAVHCLGTIYEAAGDSAIGTSALVCQTVLRTLKASPHQTGFRATVFKTLGLIVKGIRKAVDESVARDIWRQARSAATNDKSLLVQASACWAAEQLFQWTPYLDNSNDFEKLQSALWKTMDSTSSMVRCAAASCLAVVLVKSYSVAPNPVTQVKKTRRSKPKAEDEEGEEEAIPRSSSPAAQKPITSLSFSLSEILRMLSTQYCRPATNNRVRAAIAFCYTRILKGLDEGVVQRQYSTIAQHFFNDLLNSPNVINHKYRLLITRKFVRINLSDIVCNRILGETSQTNAIKFLVNSVLKDYPQSDVKERLEPSREALIAALDALTSLIGALGSATSSCSDICRDGILQVLQHPSHSVQIHAAKTLQALAIACPHQLLPAATTCMNNVNKDIGQQSTPRRDPRRSIGYAYGLAALISTASKQPLYGSIDLYSRVLSQATAILKSSSGSDLRISSMQIQAAWIMIGGLMSLGPNFVKIHLSQLLLMWRNALPRPLSKDNNGQRGLLELSFLAHVRECALGSIRAFLTYNGRLLTLDVSKRLALMLQNTTLFLNSLPSKNTTDDTEKLLSPSFQLQDYELMLRRCVFECYMKLLTLGPEGSNDALLQSSAISIAASSFADPEDLSAESFSASIAASSETFDNIWEVGDNSAFGLTGLVNRHEIKSLFIDEDGRNHQPLHQRSIDAVIDEIIRTPTCGDVEHDPVQIYAKNTIDDPDPLGAGVVNSAIRLFARAFPLQSSKVQQGALEQISTLLASASQQQHVAREIAVTINVTTALLLALNYTTKGSVAHTPSRIAAVEVQKAAQELLHVFVVHTDHSVRNLAAEATGRLCKISGNDFTAREIGYLIDTIVSNREPHARAGCAMALGCIHSELGSIAAGLHLKNILGVLTSLASDPHPTVHFWALDAISKVADSAGLAFSAYVSNTLGLVSQFYIVDSHNEEAASLVSSNIETELPAPTAVARCVDSLINVLGPDLQETAKTRNLILTLTYQFQLEESPLLTTESLRCLEHLSMYAPSHISFAPYIRQLQAKIGDENPDIRDAALGGLYNSMRRGAEEVLKAASPSLEPQLWLALHDMYGAGTINKIILDWVEQSGMTRLDAWIQRIQRVLTTVRKSTDKPVAAAETAKDTGNEEPNLQDEEVAGFNAASKAEKEDAGPPPDSTQELLRWQTRYIAMTCLNQILSAAVKEVESDEGNNVIETLQPRVADIVRLAFSASTAQVVEIRVCGVQVIGRLLQIFGRVPDPDFPEVTLLEQYQAQISSALTPAFAADSSPALAAEAIYVCATFISTGIVTDKDRMGRILRLLVTALEDFSKDNESAAIGDLKGLSSSAHVMVKLSVFSAWAALQVASHEQEYLKDIVKPHLTKLTPLWLGALREYARLKFEPDVSGSAAVTGGIDTIYAALNREALLKFYQSCWLQFVNAITSLIDEDSAFVFDALDDRTDVSEANADTKMENGISYRDEPVAFFFVLFGVSFEALVTSSSSQTFESQQRTLEILRAMKKILRPSVAGHAIYQDAIFSETMDVLDRLALTEGFEVQMAIVEIARNLCTGHPSARRSLDSTSAEDHLSDDIDQLFELTRVVVLVISNHLPGLSDSGAVRASLPDSLVSVVTLALETLVNASAVFPEVIKSDLHACILHVYATIFAHGACQASLVPQALPTFRRFLLELVQHPRHDTASQLRSALSRFFTILRNAQRREMEASIQCEKNILLAITILLTSSAKLFSPSDPLVQSFLRELYGCLNHTTTTKVAAGLSRSLLLLPINAAKQSQPSATESVISGYLFPRLIGFLVTPTDIEGTQETRPIVAQSLTSFCLALPDPQKLVACEVVVPTLLQRAKEEGLAVWSETSARLMEIVAREQGAFKDVVARLDVDRKGFLEEVLKAGGIGGQRKNGPHDEVAESREPTIALKFDF